MLAVIETGMVFRPVPELILLSTWGACDWWMADTTRAWVRRWDNKPRLERDECCSPGVTKCYMITLPWHASGVLSPWLRLMSVDTNWEHLSMWVRFTQTPSYDPNENPSDCVNLFIRWWCHKYSDTETSLAPVPVSCHNGHVGAPMMMIWWSPGGDTVTVSSHEVFIWRELMSESRDSRDQRAASKLCGVHNKFTLLNVLSDQSQFSEFLNLHKMSCCMKWSTQI